MPIQPLTGAISDASLIAMFFQVSALGLFAMGRISAASIAMLGLGLMIVPIANYIDNQDALALLEQIALRSIGLGVLIWVGYKAIKKEG